MSSIKLAACKHTPSTHKGPKQPCLGDWNQDFLAVRQKRNSATIHTVHDYHNLSLQLEHLFIDLSETQRHCIYTYINNFSKSIWQFFILHTFTTLFIFFKSGVNNVQWWICQNHHTLHITIPWCNWQKIDHLTAVFPSAT